MALAARHLRHHQQIGGAKAEAECHPRSLTSFGLNSQRTTSFLLLTYLKKVGVEKPSMPDDEKVEVANSVQERNYDGFWPIGLRG